MVVTLLHNTPLSIADKAIGKCWDKPKDECDVARIERVANKHKHSSTIEHLTYSFDIDGVSRALLQELARHRMANLSVKSSRYTLKELKTASDLELYSFYVLTGKSIVDANNFRALVNLRAILRENVNNDIVKYMLPEAYKTSLVWTINARSLQNFLALRTNKAALWEIRELAYEIFKQLPQDHKFLFVDSLYLEDKLTEENDA